MAAEGEADAGSSHSAELAIYLDLLEAYQRAELTIDEFESQFYKLYNHDDTDWNQAELDALERLFYVLEDFLSDEMLRAEVGGTDVHAVQTQAHRTLLELRELTRWRN